MLDPKLTPKQLHNIAGDQAHLNDDILQDIRTHPNAYLELRDWAARNYGMPTPTTAPPAPPEPEPTSKRRWKPNKTKARPDGHKPHSAKRHRLLIIVPIAVIALGAALTWATRTLDPATDTAITQSEQPTQSAQSEPTKPIPEDSDAQSGADTDDADLGTITRAGAASYTCQTLGTGVECWGYLTDTKTQNPRAIKDLEDTPITALAVGKTFVTAIDTEGAVYWWKPAKNPDVEDLGTIPLPITAIAAGNDHACALIGGNAWCWGSNQVGQIRGVATDTQMEPTEIDGPTRLTDLGSTGYEMWASSPEGIWVWGNNKFGQANPNDPADTTPPTLIPWQPN